MKLRLATDAEKRARDLLSQPTWGPWMSGEQFVEREARLSRHPFAHASQRTWFLQSEWSSEVLASCETFALRATLEGQPVQVHGVASVFIEERLRRHGYASALLQLLPEAVRADAPKAVGLLLFSDVGLALYEKAGFTALPSPTDWVARAALKTERPQRVEPLDETAAAALSPGRPATGLHLFDAAQLDWHRERERIYSELLHRRRPLFAGARNEGGQAVWVANFRTEELLVLHLEGPRPAGVLQAACRVAADVGLKTVRVWETPSISEAIPSGFTREPRKNSLPMFRPLRDSVPAPVDVPRGVWL